MMREAKRRREGRAGLESYPGEIGDARRQSFDVAPRRIKRNAVVGIGGPEDPEVSFIEGQMHMIETEKVEDRDAWGLSGRPAYRCIGAWQAALRLADHMLISLSPLSG